LGIDTKVDKMMMRAFNTGSNKIAIEPLDRKRWQQIAIVSLGFWMSATLILDLVVMPTLWATGMMESSGFATAGYSLFWIFNRIELLCGAIVLSSIWAAISTAPTRVATQPQLLAGASVLLAIALSYTFVITPYMSGLSLDLDIMAIAKHVPLEMDRLHSIYWVLEASKLGIAGMLLSLLSGKLET
jgi:hypothetical protein